MADTPIDNLLITIKQTGGGEVAKTLESMAKGLRALRDSASGTKATAFNNLASGIKTIADAAANIKGIENLERMAAALERLKALGAIKIKVPKISTSGKGGSSGGTVSGSGTASGDSGAGGVADELEATADKLENLTMSAKEADKVLASLKNKYFGWMKAIGRVAIYRAIRSVIKSIMQSLNDGLKHFYQYSVKVNGLYATARTEIKTSMHYVSDALGAAAGQLIEKIYPVVVKILDATAETFNNISEMIAYLSGEETYTRAVRGVADINAEAKKLKATILGFDEINKLNGNNGSGSDEYGHFEEALVDKKRAKITSAIVGSISAIFVGSKVLSLAQDFKKLAEALGVKGVAGAALEASGNFDGLGKGFDTASSSASGFATALEKVAAGVIAVAGAVTTFKAGEDIGKGDTTPGKKIQGGAGILATTLAGAKLGGIPGAILGALGGTAVGIAGMLKGEIDNGYFDRHELSVNSAWELLGDTTASRFQGFSSVAEKDAIRMSGKALDEVADINNKLAGVSPTAPYSDAYKQDKIASMFPGMPSPSDLSLWDGTNGVAVTSGTTTQVTVELDGDVLATAMAGAGHRIDRRGSNRDELR